MAHERHQAVRERFAYRCGYCGVSEADTGGELTVDHHQPSSAGGDESDKNLVYCCSRCNLYKGDFWPTAADITRGWRILHPSEDDLTHHLRLSQRTAEIEPLTETGRFHIALLQLNRPALVAHRLQKRLLMLLAEKEQLLQTENVQLRATIRAQEEYLVRMRRWLGLPE